MSNETGPTAWRRGLAPALALAGVVCWLALAPGALAVDATTVGQSTAPPAKPLVSATLVQCVTSANQAERAATFAGEMASIAGAAKLEMRIDLLERTPHEVAYHAVTAPGLDVWRTAAPGVKTYRYLKEVTNLSAPASYRAAVHFRWLNAKGKLMRADELRTPRCLEAAGPGGTQKPGEEPAPVA